MGKTRYAWLKWLAGFIAFTGIFGVASFLTAANSFKPPSPSPSFVEVCIWAVSGEDPVAFVTALLAGLGALASAVQLFGPKPATKEDVTADGDATRSDLAKMADIQAAESEQARERHAALMVAIRDSGIETAIAAIREGRITDADRERLYSALALQMKKADVDDSRAEAFARTAVELAYSPDEQDRKVADALVAEGPELAADQLMAIISATLAPLSTFVPFVGGLATTGSAIIPVLVAWRQKARRRSAQAAAIYAVANSEKESRALAVNAGMKALEDFEREGKTRSRDDGGVGHEGGVDQEAAPKSA